MPPSRGSSEPRNQTQISCIATRFFTIRANREALLLTYNLYTIKYTHFKHPLQWVLVNVYVCVHTTIIMTQNSLQKVPSYPSAVNPQLQTPAPYNHESASCPFSSAFSTISHMWTHTAYRCLSLAPSKKYDTLIHIVLFYCWVVFYFVNLFTHSPGLFVLLLSHFSRVRLCANT